MIRLNCNILIENSNNREALVEKAVELVELSLRDKGCIDYDVFGSLTNDDHLLIYETWENESDLKSHMESDHFKRIVPELEKLGTLTLEKFNF
ncbi:MAG: antibiotic biosynthesis monooxygenase [Candidatus Amulumruptor caecigallinarius]|nr:antibiotic biosynthesis monooxygenase [Candidatus Amulumruptor caecigallinarius]